ncbi:MAG: YoaH family protein [Enterobacteriaceae bacterium]|jgi:uncharacterized protein YoaH (UPF0181 family)|nr:YoaH family protein [Enterobacteriaceae bacterium]
MTIGSPALQHHEQQEAVDRIHQLMAEGMSSGEAIALVAQEIRANHQGESAVASFDDDEEE